MEERKAKDCLKKLDPIDSLYFDVSVARHMIEEGKYDEADVWLDPNHALLELRRSLKQDFITTDEYSALEITIGDIRSTIKITGELLQAMKTITELQTFLAVRAYHSFLKCMLGSNPSDELTADEKAVCEDFIRKIKETGQVYIVDHDVPISISKYVYRLLDAKRRAVAEQKGIPEVQYEWEDFFFHIGLHPGSNPGKAEPLIPYWALPAAFTLILVGAAFAGWVASQLEGEA